MPVRMSRMRRLLVLVTVPALVLSFMPATALGATTWVVNSTDDTDVSCTASACTLRAAILAANASSGGDTIVFDISPNGPKTISVGSGSANSLPIISGDDVIIDGSTQPGGGPRGIQIDDPDSTGGEYGLQITGDRAVIRGLSITRFDVDGIYVRGGSEGNVIQGNWIGTSTGNTKEGQLSDGIRIQQPGGNLIGGLLPGQANLIAGNNGDAVDIDGSSDNVVLGNILGLSADGINRLGNSGSGVVIRGDAYRNRVGGPNGGRNIISANGQWGVYLLGVMSSGTCTGPENNVVQGNWVGPNANGQMPPGTSTVSNGAENIYLRLCARNNLLGGPNPGEGNVVAGSHNDGLEIDSQDGPGGLLGSCYNTVQGNIIGADPTGMVPLPNHDDGVAIDNGSCHNQVGGLNPGEGNLIGGNFNDGVEMSRPYSTQNVVQGNVIGLAADGSTPLRNTQHGVNIRYKADYNLVEGNVISANVLSGVYINQHLSWYNIIRGNKIGTNVAGTSARGNKQNGVYIYDGARYNRIEDNLIQGNTLDGVAVERVPGSTYTTRFNTITRNRILDNGGSGIDLLPSDGPDANDGAWNDAYGNRGVDHPVVTAATSVSAKGTAPAFTTVEVFKAAPGSGETQGEGSVYLGTVTAAGNGTWCLGAVSIASGAVTATTTDSAGNTSEFGPNRTVAGANDLCAPPPPPPAFSDNFTGADGSAPANWELRKSAVGTGAGGSIASNELKLNVVLSAAQEGTTQYVQARAVPFQPNWANTTQSVAWQMTTFASGAQRTSMYLLPTAVTTNAVSSPDYLRVGVAAGVLSIVSRVGGSSTTLYSGAITAEDALHRFELRINSTSLWLYEGASGAEVLRSGPVAHGLPWTTGHMYLHGSSTSSAAPYAPRFDNVAMGPTS